MNEQNSRLLHNSKVLLSGVFLALLLATGQARAIPFEIFGLVELSDCDPIDCPFGLEFGDTITASGSYDLATFNPVGGATSGYFDFLDVSSNSMTIDFGTATFTDADAAFGLGSELWFKDGIFDGIFYDGELGDFSLLFSNGFIDNVPPFYDFSALDPDFRAVEGNWKTAGAIVLPPVPVPAAIWLFGSALIGLVGFGRRKSRHASLA